MRGFFFNHRALLPPPNLYCEVQSSMNFVLCNSPLYRGPAGNCRCLRMVGAGGIPSARDFLSDFKVFFRTRLAERPVTPGTVALKRVVINQISLYWGGTRRRGRRGRGQGRADASPALRRAVRDPSSRSGALGVFMSSSCRDAIRFSYPGCAVLIGLMSSRCRRLAAPCRRPVMTTTSVVVASRDQQFPSRVGHCSEHGAANSLLQFQAGTSA